MKLFVRFTLLLVLVIAANPLAARDQAPAAPAGRVLAKPNYDLAARWTSAKVREVRLLDRGHATLARVQRPVLVQLRDAGGREVVDRRSGQEDEDAALG